MPDFGRVSQIDASTFEPGGAYVAVKRPLLDDLAPYIFRTRDFGKTWTKIVTGIPAERLRPRRARGPDAPRPALRRHAEHGVYVSFNDGDKWEPLSLNLPGTPVSDLIVEDNSIAISTHGRGFYILDDISALRATGLETTSADVVLFKPADAVRGAGGATITYLLRKPAEKLTIEVLDAKGQIAQTIQGAPPAGRGGRGRGEAGGRGETAAAETPEGEGGGGGRGRGGPPTASLAPGLNRITWNLAYPGATTFPGMVLWGATTNGPAAVPGNYQVRLTVDGKSQTQPLVVKRHPLRTATDADLQEQFDLAIRIRDKVTEANNAVIQIRNIKREVADRLTKSPDAQLKSAGDRLTTNLSAVEEEIYQVKNQSGQDPLNFPIKINNRLASLLRVVNTGDGKPIANAEPILKDLSAELKVQTDRLAKVIAADLPAFNTESQRVGVGVVTGK